VAVFDDEDRAQGWRHQRLPEYKAGRAPMPETLDAEMPALRAAFEQRGIRCWALAGNEADDLAATLASKSPMPGIRRRSSRPIKAIASCCRRRF
jgi:protein Xni